MQPIACPHCSTTVLPNRQRICPSCRGNVDDPNQGPPPTVPQQSSLGSLDVSRITAYGWLLLVVVPGVLVAIAIPLALHIRGLLPPASTPDKEMAQKLETFRDVMPFMVVGLPAVFLGIGWFQATVWVLKRCGISIIKEEDES